MAKDGTCRGGARVGAGKKRKALMDVMVDGNRSHNGPVKRIKAEDLPDLHDACSEIENVEMLNPDDHCDPIPGVEMPKPQEYLDALQRDGKPFGAGDVYRKVFNWLKNINCENLVSNELIEQYSVAYSRWKQCEEAVTKYGLVARHPLRPESVCQSPFVQMSIVYMKQTSQLWFQIFSVVRENCATDINDKPCNDEMEQLLRQREDE